MKDFYRAVSAVYRAWLRGWIIFLRLAFFVLIAGSLLWAAARLIAMIPDEHIGRGEVFFFSVLYFGALVPLACWVASRVTGELRPESYQELPFVSGMRRRLKREQGPSLEIEQRIRARRGGRLEEQRKRQQPDDGLN
jgi:hypothetical protein